MSAEHSHAPVKSTASAIRIPDVASRTAITKTTLPTWRHRRGMCSCLVYGTRHGLGSRPRLGARSTSPRGLPRRLGVAQGETGPALGARLPPLPRFRSPPLPPARPSPCDRLPMMASRKAVVEQGAPVLVPSQVQLRVPPTPRAPPSSFPAKPCRAKPCRAKPCRVQHSTVQPSPAQPSTAESSLEPVEAESSLEPAVLSVKSETWKPLMASYVSSSRSRLMAQALTRMDWT